MIAHMFILDSEDVEKACGHTMTQFLESVFPDLWQETDNQDHFQNQKKFLKQLFLDPLIANM